MLVRIKKLYVTAGFILTLLVVSGVIAAEEVRVKYVSNGQQYQVIGKKTGEFEYFFHTNGDKQITCVTLDWTPYIGQDICYQGWVQQVAVALFGSRGYNIKSQFYPWNRAMMMAETGKADVLYPEYFIDEAAPSSVIPNTKRLQHLALSRKIPGGPIAFLKRKGEPDKFNGDLLNLKDEKIGVVRGYQNTPEFDILMQKEYFHTDYANNDIINARKLIKGRVNLIIGDPTVIFFSVANDSSIDAHEKEHILNGLEVVEPAIRYNNLFFAVSKKNRDWEKILHDLNSAIIEFEGTGEIDRIIHETKISCGFEVK